MVSYEKIESAPEAEIVALYEAAGWWEEGADARDSIAKVLRGSFCVFGAKDEEGRLIGMGRAISDGASDAYIQDVVVLKEFRGRGIGREIINHLTEYCLDKGIVWLGLIGEPGTESFYRNLGFAPMTDYIPMIFQKKNI